jgi:hypothetical protein
VPYRNSLMTQVLRDSLGGNCRTVMVATINPADGQLEESISTCRFAQRVALVTNTVGGVGWMEQGFFWTGCSGSTLLFVLDIISCGHVSSVCCMLSCCSVPVSVFVPVYACHDPVCCMPSLALRIFKCV